MEFIKVKTKSGKVVHVGARYAYDGSVVGTCSTAKGRELVEQSADAEVTCKSCSGLGAEMDRDMLAAQEVAPVTVPAPEIIQTIRISADMEEVLTRDVRISTSLQTARDAGVSWGAGKLLVTREGRDALLWFLDMRATVAQEALTDGRPVYPARRALWHAAVKLNRQVSYTLAA